MAEETLRERIANELLDANGSPWSLEGLGPKERVKPLSAADAVLALLDGPEVEIVGDSQDCRYGCCNPGGMGPDDYWCNLLDAECNPDNCPGPGKYRLIKVGE